MSCVSIILLHPDLILEFLVPARGRDSAKPYSIEALGISAQPLRFMDFLAQDPVQLLFGGLPVTVPHPANFALQKLLIANRRTNKEKSAKDRAQAVAILNGLHHAGEFARARRLYREMKATWRRHIDRELKTLGQQGILSRLRDTEPSSVIRRGTSG